MDWLDNSSNEQVYREGPVFVHLPVPFKLL